MIVYTSNITEHNNWFNVEKNIMNIDKEGIFVSFCDIYFNDHPNNIINEKWYGIIHNPVDWELYTPWGDKRTLFNISSFIDSLKFCKILFVMAESQIIPIKNLLYLNGFTSIKVISLIHPINKLNYEFNYDKYILNNSKSIYSIGNWLRKQYSIFKLNVCKKFNKKIIPFTKRTKLELEYYIKYDNIVLTDDEKNSVNKVEYINTYDYHKIFEDNIVFLDVYLTTINNTFLEAIISNTPIILNRKQEYIDIIGENYPLFFDNIDDINSFIEDDNNILIAHNYLKNIDKTKFTIDYFIKNIKEKLNDE
jgi:hypothetical protein